MLSPLPGCPRLLLILLLTVCLPSVLTAETSPNRIRLPEGLALHPVDATHPDWPVIQQEVDRLQETRFGNVRTVNQVRRIEGRAIETLFPDWRFYRIAFTHSAEPGYENVISILGPSALTLAVGSQPDVSLRLSGNWNFEVFGNLLRTTETRIEDEEDARLVWQAFCEIHWKAFVDRAVERVSETEWRLGIHRHDEEILEDGLGLVFQRITYSHPVSTDSSHRVTGWNSQAEPSWNLVGSDGGLREIFPPPSIAREIRFHPAILLEYGIWDLKVQSDGSVHLQVGVLSGGDLFLPANSVDFHKLWWAVHEKGLREKDNHHPIYVEVKPETGRSNLRTCISVDLLPEVFLNFNSQDWKTPSGGPLQPRLMEQVQKVLQAIREASASSRRSESTAQQL